MPECRKESVVSVNTGDITVENITETLAEGEMGGDYGEITASFTIPAGAYKVTVKNIGISGTVTVDGDTVTPNIPWTKEARENRITGRLDLCPEVAIVISGGARAYYQTDTPSA